MRSPLNLLQGTKPNSFNLLTQERFSSHLMVFMAVLCTFSNLSMSSFNITPGGMITSLISASYTCADAAQDPVYLWCWIMISLLSLYPSGPLHQGFSQPHGSWPVLSSLVVPFQVQDRACLCLFSQSCCCPTLSGSLALCATCVSLVGTLLPHHLI